MALGHSIGKFVDEEFLPDFEDFWETYRAFMREGIVAQSTTNIRNLFGQASMVESHAKVKYALAKAEFEPYDKLFLEISEAQIAHELRDVKAKSVSELKLLVKNHPKYLETMNKRSDLQRIYLIYKAEAEAAEVARETLSREMNFRKE